MHPEPQAVALKLVLRIIGGSSLTALVFVVAPYSWMNAIHDGWLGMGPLSSQPVVGYLARRSPEDRRSWHGRFARQPALTQHRCSEERQQHNSEVGTRAVRLLRGSGTI